MWFRAMNALALILVTIIAVANADYYPITVQGIKCAKESDIVTNVTCNLRVVNRTTKFIDMDMYIPRKLEKFYINGAVLKKIGAMYRQFMVNITEDYCAYISGKFSLGLNIIFGYNKHSLYNFKCPIEGYFGIRDFEARVHEVFGAIPLGYYRLDLNLLEDRNLFASIKILGSWTDKLRKT